MVFWCRIRHSRVEWLSHQCKRWYFQIPGISSANCIAGGTRIRVLEKPNSFNQRRPTEMYDSVRFFAAPVQAKPKPEAKDQSGPRMNNQIRSEFIRLVTDEGHEVVSRREALDRARKLNLDLVEVQRTANPPVCKIMDFHREKYKKQLMEKDRAKTKSEVTLRKGDCKEVRFSGKTEQKDLQMKADTVKRLMEKGYRVKCMVMGTEDQDLGGLLSRLSALIEDVCVVESGPRAEKRQAYVIVRHIKFGPSKKGPVKKAVKVVEPIRAEVQSAATSSPTINSSNPIQSPLQIEEDWKPTESGLESEDEIIPDRAETPVAPSMEMPNGVLGENKMLWPAFDASDDFEEVFDIADNGKGVRSSSTDGQMDSTEDTILPREDVAKTGLLYPKPVLGSTKAKSVPSSAPKPSLEGRNRYNGRSEFQTTSTEKTSDDNKLFSELSKFSSSLQRSHVNRVPGVTDSAHLESQLPNQGRQPRTAVNASPSTATEQKQLRTDAFSLRNLKQSPTDETSKQQLSHTGTTNSSSPAPNYGIFSASKPTAPSKQNAATEANRDKEINSLNSTHSPTSSVITQNGNPPKPKAESSQRPEADKTRQGGWGVFSREASSADQKNSSS